MNKLNENIFNQYNKWKQGYARKENSLQMRLNDFLSKRIFESDKYYHISEDGKHVDCDGTVVKITDSDLIDGKFPFPFGKVKGDFACWSCKSLISLEGSPKEVGGDFLCYRCSKIKSLEGAPEEINRCFDCSECSKLTSLEGAPEKVGESFSCKHCYSLTSLKGLPKIIKWILYIDEDMKNKLPEYAKTFKIRI